MANKIDKELEITVVNNTMGSFSYQHKDVYIELDERGDAGELTFGELKSIMSSPHKNVLKKLQLIITDVDSEEVTISEVIKQLKLSRYYDPVKELIDTDYLDADSFEEFVLNSDEKEFKKAIKNESLSSILIENVAILYKGKKLTDYSKLRLAAQEIGVSDYGTYFQDLAPK